MDVTDVLRDRMGAPAGLQRMVSISLALHIALATGIALAPGGWIGRPIERPRNMMTISLSGAGEGPRNGGMSPAPGRSVQTAPEDLAKREPARAPAAKPPEMTMPKANARTTKAPSTRVEQAPAEARGRTPTRGETVTPGNAIANAPIRGQGFGLSTGGGPGTGSFLEVADFCCPDYIVVMVDRIRSVWAQNQGATGTCLVRFTIQRSGQISDASIETPSGTASLDLAALRAVLSTRSLPPLPDGFAYPRLPVHLSFEYK